MGLRLLVVLVFLGPAACASAPPAVSPLSIAGTVIGANGQPLPGVRVILQPLAAAAPVLSSADPMVLTDTHGRFSFDTPPVGRHQLLLLHPTLGWLIAQGAAPGPPLRLTFDGKTRVIDIGRR